MDNVSFFFLIFNLNKSSLLLRNRHSLIFDNLMIFGATYLITLTILFIFVLGLKGGTREKKALLLILLGLPVAFLLIKGIHLFFYEPRPFITFHLSPLVSESANASFPSRHATILSVIAFSFAYLKSKWTPLFLILMVWVGVSRAYVGVHYPLDIAGGFLTGIIALVMAVQVKKILKIGLLR